MGDPKVSWNLCCSTTVSDAQWRTKSCTEIQLATGQSSTASKKLENEHTTFPSLIFGARVWNDWHPTNRHSELVLKCSQSHGFCCLDHGWISRLVMLSRTTKNSSKQQQSGRQCRENQLPGATSFISKWFLHYYYDVWEPHSQQIPKAHCMVCSWNNRRNGHHFRHTVLLEKWRAASARMAMVSTPGGDWRWGDTLRLSFWLSGEDGALGRYEFVAACEARDVKDWDSFG